MTFYFFVCVKLIKSLMKIRFRGYLDYKYLTSGSTNFTIYFVDTFYD